MGEVVPGPVVERVDSGEDGVEVHDMDVAAGNRLEACLISGRAGHGRGQDRHRRVFTGQARGDTGEQLRKWVPDAATIDDCQRAGGDRAPCGLVDEVSTGERRGVGGDTRPGRRLGVAGPDALRARRPAARRAPGRSRRRCGSAPPSMRRRRHVRCRVRSPGRDRGSRGPAARDRRRARPAPPRGAARTPVPDRR